MLEERIERLYEKADVGEKDWCPECDSKACSLRWLPWYTAEKIRG